MTDMRPCEGEKTAQGKGERQVKGQIIPEIVNQSHLISTTTLKLSEKTNRVSQIGICKTKYLKVAV